MSNNLFDIDEKIEWPKRPIKAASYGDVSGDLSFEKNENGESVLMTKFNPDDINYWIKMPSYDSVPEFKLLEKHYNK